MTRGSLAGLLLATIPVIAAAGPRGREPRDRGAPTSDRARSGGAPAARLKTHPGVDVGVATSMDKLRPAGPFPRGQSIDLTAARGECESAQIAVRPRKPIAALAADAPPLDGTPRIDLSLYRVAFLDLPRPSGLDGEAGAWPDPLIPARDGYFGEARRAFPVRVGAGELQAIWVEVCVPHDARPGRWRGEVVLRDGTTELARVPVHLRAWPFEIPATSSIPVTFGLSTRLGTQALGAPMDREIARALAAAALRHRITPHGLSHDPPSGKCTESGCSLDWSAYDAEMAPILDGKLVPGARGTWAEARIPKATWEGPEAALRETLRAWREHFAERGWSDRLWLYTLDEPRPEQIAELTRRARVARAAGVRVFVTHEPIPQLRDQVAAFAPNLTFFDDGALRSWRSPIHEGPGGGRPFWYASCLSHGCDEVPDFGAARQLFTSRFRGWPGYEIDRPSAAARAMGWLAWREQVAGELYFDMIQTWRGDPWRDPRAFAGNGDGTLLYPGLPEQLGGRHPFPVESIRLKVIRDGLEDLELLRLAEHLGLEAEARRIAARVAPNLRGFARDPDAWIAARLELGNAIARRMTAAAARAER